MTKRQTFATDLGPSTLAMSAILSATHIGAMAYQKMWPRAQERQRHIALDSFARAATPPPDDEAGEISPEVTPINSLYDYTWLCKGIYIPKKYGSCSILEWYFKKTMMMEHWDRYVFHIYPYKHT